MHKDPAYDIHGSNFVLKEHFWALDTVREIVARALQCKETGGEVINCFIEKIQVKVDGTVRLYYRFAGTL